MVQSLHVEEVEFISLTEGIQIMEMLVDNIGSEQHLDNELSSNIMVALSEAINNAFLHGCQKLAGKHVRLKLELSSHKMVFFIQDEGLGFNISELKDPTAPENIDKPTGRGIFLMRRLADIVEFKENGRKVVLTFFH